MVNIDWLNCISQSIREDRKTKLFGKIIHAVLARAKDQADINNKKTNAI